MDIQDVQVVFADLLPSFVSGSRTVSPHALATACGILAKGAVALHLPITFSLVPEVDKESQLIPELQNYRTANNTFWRTTASILHDPPTALAIGRHNRKTMVLSGFTAEVVVVQTALEAIEAGFRVCIPVDAVGSRSARTEDSAFRQIERAGGTLTSIASILSRLAPEFSRPPGSLILPLLRSLPPTG